VAFAAFGAFWGVWGASVPRVQDRTGVTDGQLGLALLFVGAGALPAMLLVGRALDRWGLKVAALVLSALGVIGAGLALTAVNLLSLCIGLTLVGASSGAADVAMKRAILDSRGRPAVFVSVGGNWAAAGPGESLLGRTGLLTPGQFKPEGTGLVQSYLRDRVPVIRILDVQDLCVRTGLPFDPIPWPAEGRSSLYRGTLPPRPLIALGPVLAILAAVLVKRRQSSWLR